MAFVLGAGPSLRHVSNEDIKPHVTFTVNSSLLKMKDCDYFVSDDQHSQYWNYFQIVAKESQCIKLLYKDKLEEASKLFNPQQVAFYRHKTWYDPNKKIKPKDGVKMTKDPYLPIIGARTSVGSAVHLAYIMGCDPIVLLGCDCCLQNNKRYFWEFNGYPKAFLMKKVSKPKSRIIKNINGKMIDNHGRDFLEYWKDFAESNKNVNIINGSVESALEVFPKKEFKAIINEFGKK